MKQGEERDKGDEGLGAGGKAGAERLRRQEREKRLRSNRRRHPGSRSVGGACTCA